MIVAPATADFLAKMTAGIAEDLLGTTLLATTAPVVVAPAMHTEMWRHPATTQNIETLRGRGVHVVGPADGPLTGGDSGPGRMSEPEVIVARALALVRSDAARDDLRGIRAVVTAGGTREPIDPVRFIGNRSSGRQGVARRRRRGRSRRGCHAHRRARRRRRARRTSPAHPRIAIERVEHHRRARRRRRGPRHPMPM